MQNIAAFYAIKRLIKEFLLEKEILTQCGIHLIEQNLDPLSEGQLILTIHLSRPGIFIGKAGATIDKLTKLIEEGYNLPTKIDLKEFDPFR
jgi:ribosomal protein S3